MKHTNHRCDPTREGPPPSRQSDHAWLAEVFRENEIPLMGYATHLLGDPDRASDVVQDTFVRLCNQSREQIGDKVRQWLFRVCRNRALDVIKKESRMKTLGDQKASLQISRDGDPSSKAELAERHASALGLLSKLPAKQQEVIRLKIHAGLSYREISDLTGLSVGNIGFLLSTGLKLVRTRMATSDS